MQTDSGVFKIIFRDEDKNCVIDKVESNVIPVVGDIVLLSTKEKFEINSRVISKVNFFLFICFIVTHTSK